MKIITIIGIVTIIAATVVACYACCVAAGTYDRSHGYDD